MKLTIIFAILFFLFCVIGIVIVLILNHLIDNTKNGVLYKREKDLDRIYVDNRYHNGKDKK